MLKKITIISVIALFIVVAFTACDKTEESKTEKVNNTVERIYEVGVVKPEIKRLHQHISATGTANADKEVKINATVSGVIDKIYYDKGDFVKAGDLLADIDIEKYKLGVEQAKAALSQAKAAFNNAETELKRKKKLYDKNAISDGIFDAVKTRYESAKAALEMAKVSLKGAKITYEEAHVRTPISGFIIYRGFEAGEYVNTMRSGPMFSVIKADPLKINFAVPEKYAGMLKKGYEFKVRFPALTQKEYAGTITIVSPAIDQMTRTISIEGAVRNPDLEIKAGSFTEISIKVSKTEDSMVIPSSAIISEQGEKYVFRVVDNRAKRTRVNPGVIVDGMIEILGGINTDDLVIVEGISEIHDGAEVKIKNEKQ